MVSETEIKCLYKLSNLKRTIGLCLAQLVEHVTVVVIQ